MTDSMSEGPSLIKLGKLANSKEFAKLEAQWEEAFDHPGYSWNELIPIAGQVGRQGDMDRAAMLMESLIRWVEEKKGPAAALEAVRKAAAQLKAGGGMTAQMRRLYALQYPDFEELPDLLEIFLGDDAVLEEVLPQVETYIHLHPGAFVVDRSYLMPGVVESIDGTNGQVVVRFDDRRQEYGPETITKLSARPENHYPSLMIYAPERLRELANEDAAAFIKLALASNRENKVMYRDLKNQLTDLMGEKGWKSWWKEAKPAIKRDPMIGMTAGSQPSFRLLRQADKYEDRLKRKFDHCKDPLAKLAHVMAYLDEITREEKQGTCKGCADDELMAYFGNGAAKVAVGVLKESPSVALAGLALHAEVAARGVDVARPNPKAAVQVLARVEDKSALTTDLPEAMLQRVLNYLRVAMPDTWGDVWSAVLMRAGKRLCDSITRNLIENGQDEALVRALTETMERPTSSPDLLCWLWRSLFTTGPAGQFLAGREEVSAPLVGNAMFALLDSAGKLYGMSTEEKHLKALESARASIATQNNRPLLGLIDAADRREGIRLKGVIENNGGLSPAQRTQLLGYLRSKYADIFIEITREWEDGGTIYTTEDGLRESQSGLNFIIEVEIPEVARQIGEAASFGDLSENSEYTAALEKRDQLASRATRMENELSVAKVINHEMAASDFVNVGTRVTTRSIDSGEEEIYTFLGPWDTDVKNRILNYQAPLAMAFMGARVGDTVVFGEDTEQRSWEVLAIEGAI